MPHVFYKPQKPTSALTERFTHLHTRNMKLFMKCEQMKPAAVVRRRSDIITRLLILYNIITLNSLLYQTRPCSCHYVHLMSTNYSGLLVLL